MTGLEAISKLEEIREDLAEARRYVRTKPLDVQQTLGFARKFQISLDKIVLMRSIRRSPYSFVGANRKASSIPPDRAAPLGSPPNLPNFRAKPQTLWVAIDSIGELIQQLLITRRDASAGCGHLGRLAGNLRAASLNIQVSPDVATGYIDGAHYELGWLKSWLERIHATHDQRTA